MPPLGVDRDKTFRTILVGAAVCAAVFSLTLRASTHGYSLTGPLWRSELEIVGLWYACTILHEMGHAIAASLRGFQLISIYVGPLFVTRSALGGVRLGIRPTLFGGAVLAVPREWRGEQRFRRDYFWFVAGGPAASLLCGALALTSTRPVMLIGALISLTFGVVTLIPTRRGSGRTSDGEKLREVRRPEVTYGPILALRLMLHTQRPREWAPALVAVLATESALADRDAIDATLLLYYHTLDRGDAAEAAVLLQRAIDYVCGSARWPRPTVSIEVGTEAALFEAAWRRDVAAAQAWLERTPHLTRSAKGRQLFADALAGTPSAIAKLTRRYRRMAHPGPWLLTRATLERLAAASSSGSD